jgi:hypothetical protein
MDTDLVPVFGEVYLRYVLAVDGDRDLAAIPSTSPQSEVLEALRQLVSSAPAASDVLARHAQLSSLLSWRVETGSSISNALRLHAGGSLPDLSPTPDPLATHLMLIAQDAWPSFLVPPPQTGPAAFWLSIPVAAFGHPSMLAAAKAFLRDPDLKGLFPDAPSGKRLERLDKEEVLQVQSEWISSTGQGGTKQLISLLSMMISNARLWALTAQGDESWEGLCEALPGVLGALRCAARGEVANVPRCVAFVGLTLPDGVSIDLSAGQLRSPRAADDPFLVPREVGATAILSTTYPLTIHEIRPWRPTEHPELPPRGWEGVRKIQQEAQREIDLTRLAAVLASTAEHPWSLTQVASMVVDPTLPGGAMSWERNPMIVRQAELDAHGGARIVDWRLKVDAQHSPKLEIAMRRVLGAAGNRLDPVDGLVDAVIAWENCFGTDSETTFRVTSAIACLLEGDEDARLGRLRELKKIYEKRSRIVHGALDLDLASAGKLRDDALDVALDCLRLLYTTHTHLIPMAPADRSTTLLLAG